MGQKVNPVSLRLQKTNKHFDSCWYSDYNYTNLIVQDLKIQNYISSVLKQIKYPEPHFLIKNLPYKISINFFFCNPINSRQIRLSKFRLPPEKSKKVKEYKKSRNFLPLTTRFYPQKEMPVPEFILKRREGEKKKQFILTRGLKFFTGQQENRIKPEIYVKKSESKSKGVSLDKNISNPFLHTYNFNHNKFIDKIAPYIYSMGFFDKVTPSLLYKNLLESEALSVGNIADRTVLWDENSNFAGKIGKFVETENSSSSEPEKIRIKPTAVQILIRHWILFIYFSLKQNLSVEKQNIIQNSTKLQIFDNKEKIGSHIFPSSKSSTIPGKKVLQKAQFVISPFRDHLESVISNQLKSHVNLTSLRSLDDSQSALFLVEEIVYYLQRRVSFRAIKNQIMKEILKSKNISGIRIAFSGRLGGRSKKAQRSKTEYLRWGQTSLHVFSSQISFAHKAASTRFGLLGVKVWICFKNTPKISTSQIT